MTTTFAGMPDEGLAFLEDLEERNTKEFFDANKAVFRERVQAPFAALVEAAAARLRGDVPEVGTPKLFRIYRDLRFSKDKTPYKTSMSASVPSRAPAEGDGPGVATGYYVNVGPAGLYTASGLYHPDRADLLRVRAAIAEENSGTELEAILAEAWSPGWTRSSAPPSHGRPATRGPICSGAAPWSSTASTTAPPGSRPPSCSTTCSPTGGP